MIGKHYMGQRNPRSERFKFKSLVRTEGESIQTFAVRLLQCETLSIWRQTRRKSVDQLLAGLNLKECVKKIVGHSEGLKLSFQSAVDVALEVEEREKGTTSFMHSVVHRTHHEAKAEEYIKMLPVQP